MSDVQAQEKPNLELLKAQAAAMQWEAEAHIANIQLRQARMHEIGPKLEVLKKQIADLQEAEKQGSENAKQVTQ